MLRLMLASPAGVPAVLAGRARRRDAGRARFRAASCWPSRRCVLDLGAEPLAAGAGALWSRSRR